MTLWKGTWNPAAMTNPAAPPPAPPAPAPSAKAGIGVGMLGVVAALAALYLVFGRKS